MVQRKNDDALPLQRDKRHLQVYRQGLRGS